MLSHGAHQDEARDRGNSGRERISDAAYELFCREGTTVVGVDAVIARAGTAKMTLYRNFSSKDELILDFLRRRERVWTFEWLQAETEKHGRTPAQRLLAIFDVFGEWFRREDFDGCAFLTTMIEVKDPTSPVRRASVAHLANIRVFIAAHAAEAGIEDAEAFAHQWHILMKGSIMAAHEGDLTAADRARQLGVLLLRSHGVEAGPARRATRRRRQPTVAS
jgi:AcrR family transcriptional regulator